MKRAGKSESEGVALTEDGGIVKTILREGTGETIPAGMTASVHYVGKLLNGTEFDSSRGRGKPFTFVVGSRQVILGWDKGVATMKKGELCTLTCAPDYAYGSRGIGPIPPNSTLVFEVELLDWSEGGAGDTQIIVVIAIFLLAAYLIYSKMYL